MGLNTAMPHITWTRISVDSRQDLEASRVACTITWSQSFGFLAVMTLKDSGVFIHDKWRTGLTSTSREWLSGDWSKTTNCWKSMPFILAQWKLVLTSMRTTQSICSRGNTKIYHISADIGFRTYADRDFAHSSDYRTPWKSVTLLSTPL